MSVTGANAGVTTTRSVTDWTVRPSTRVAPVSVTRWWGRPVSAAREGEGEELWRSVRLLLMTENVLARATASVDSASATRAGWVSTASAPRGVWTVASRRGETSGCRQTEVSTCVTMALPSVSAEQTGQGLPYSPPAHVPPTRTGAGWEGAARRIAVGGGSVSATSASVSRDSPAASASWT